MEFGPFDPANEFARYAMGCHINVSRSRGEHVDWHSKVLFNRTEEIDELISSGLIVTLEPIYRDSELASVHLAAVAKKLQ
jgi:hypothetical protein